MTGFVDRFNSGIDGQLMTALGDDVTFIDGAGQSFSIQGAFYNEYYPSVRESGVPVASVTPVIECLDRDVMNACGGKIIRSGISYDIVGEPEPDGTGITILRLRKSSK